jgi:hypothetical protein
MSKSKGYRYREPVEDPRALPCPFCAYAPVVGYWHGGGPQKTMVQCIYTACAANPQVTGTTRRRALDSWNYRPAPPVAFPAGAKTV